MLGKLLIGVMDDIDLTATENESIIICFISTQRTKTLGQEYKQQCVGHCVKT